jgi:hypothetical protein
MSDRALIAFENSDGKFDLHHSHNGAGEIGQLLALLEEYHNKNDSKRPGSELSFTGLDGASGEQAMQRRAQTKAAQADGYDAKDYAGDEDAIRADPEYIDVPKSDLGEKFNFVDYEAFLTVDEAEGVRLYAPIWLEPAPMTFLRQHVISEAYDASSPTMPPQMVFQSEPEFTLSGTDYIDALDDEESDRFEQLRYMQRGMVQMALSARQKAVSSGQDPSEVTAMVTYGTTMVKMQLYNASQIQFSNPRGLGVFIEIPRMTRRDLSSSQKREFDSYLNGPNGTRPTGEDPPEIVRKMTQHFQDLDRTKQEADRYRLRVNRDEIGLTTPADDNWRDVHKSGLLSILKHIQTEHSDNIVTWTPGKFAPALEKLAQDNSPN